MTSATAVRPLPRNTVIAVKGVSHRQDAVHTIVEGDELRIVHDTVNPHDANACAIFTLSGVQLGFVPHDLAERLAVPHPGGQWRARVTEVLRKETWGLRVKVGPLVDDGNRLVPGANDPGLRHRGDGVTEDRDGAVTAEPVLAPAGKPRAGAAEPSERVNVYAKSGRLLGQLLGTEGSRVAVATKSGGKALFPAAVVRIGD